jgi:hypothetical protein
MDDGPPDGPPGRALKSACVELSMDEALALIGSLKVWADEVERGHVDSGWHTHITDDAGRELTISIRVGESSRDSPG